MPVGFWFGSTKGKPGWSMEDRWEKKTLPSSSCQDCSSYSGSKLRPQVPFSWPCHIVCSASLAAGIFAPLCSLTCGAKPWAPVWGHPSPWESTSCNAPAISSPAKMYPLLRNLIISPKRIPPSNSQALVTPVVLVRVLERNCRCYTHMYKGERERFMEAEKSYDLPSAHWGPRKASGVVQRPES